MSHDDDDDDILYLDKLPTQIPEGYVLTHNHILPTRRLGARGFRAWLSRKPAENAEVCRCTWAAELGPHYFIRRPNREWSPDTP